MVKRKSRLVIAFVLMLSLVSFFSIPASVFAADETVIESQVSEQTHPPLALSKSVDQSQVFFKDTVVQYTFKIYNNTDNVMNNVYLSDSVIGLNLSGISVPAQSGRNPGLYTTTFAFNLAGLADNMWVGGKFVNEATATCTPMQPSSLDSGLGVEAVLPLPSPPTYSASDSATVEYCPPLTIKKEVKLSEGRNYSDNATVNFKNEDVKYKLTVENNFNHDLQNVSLADPLVGLNFVIPELKHNHNNNSFTTIVAFNLSSSNVTWDVDGKFINTASASVTCAMPDQTTKTAIVTDTATVNYEPPLVLEKTVEPKIVNFKDDHVTYKFKITNNLHEDLRNLLLTDPLIGVSIPINKIEGNQHKSFDVSFDLSTLSAMAWDDNKFVNTGKVVAPYMQDGMATTLEAIDTATLTYVPPLTLEKTVSPTPVFFKDGEVAYTFLVTNNLTKGDITDVVLYDSPIGPNITIGKLKNGHPYTTTVAFDLGDLPDGSWVDNQYVNTATVMGFYAKPKNDFEVGEKSIQDLCETVKTTVTAVDTAVVTFDPTTVTINKDVPNVEGSKELFSFNIYKIVPPVSVESLQDQIGANFNATTDASILVATVPVSEVVPYTIALTPGAMYTIVEAPMAGYTTSVASITFTLVPGQDQSVLFTNTKDVVETGTSTTTRRSTTTTTTTVPVEPTPAGPVVTTTPSPIVILDEPLTPAAPALPRTGGLDPLFLYGLGLALASGGFAIKRRRK